MTYQIIEKSNGINTIDILPLRYIINIEKHMNCAYIEKDELVNPPLKKEDESVKDEEPLSLLDKFLNLFKDNTVYTDDNSDDESLKQMRARHLREREESKIEERKNHDRKMRIENQNKTIDSDIPVTFSFNTKHLATKFAAELTAFNRSHVQIYELYNYLLGHSKKMNTNINSDVSNSNIISMREINIDTFEIIDLELYYDNDNSKFMLIPKNQTKEI